MLPDQLNQLPTPPRSTYHWSLPRQRAFLEHFAISGCVSQAAAHIGVSPRAAYALRNRRDGLLFGLGWGAAVLIARYRLTDLLLERAIDGVEEVAVRTSDREDGSAEIRRRKFDGRLGMAMLARLDRMASLPQPASANEGDAGDTGEAALYRAVAQDFESFLDRLSPPPEVEPRGSEVSQDAGDTDIADTDIADTDTTNIGTTDSPAAPHDVDDTTTVVVANTAALDQAAAYAALEADARADAQARVTAHLAALASGLGPLGRLAQESRAQCELAQKTDDAAQAEDWTPPRMTDALSRELQTQIHDCFDRMEDKRAVAGNAPFNIKWDAIEASIAYINLDETPAEDRFKISGYIYACLMDYGAAWRETNADDELSQKYGPLHPFAAPEMRREDSIRSRIDRLMAEGRARALPSGAEEGE